MDNVTRGVGLALCLMAAGARADVGKVVVFDAGVPAGTNRWGCASDPAAFVSALSDAYDVRRAAADELASPAFFSAANCDLLIVPTGALFPMTAVSNLVTFLSSGGQLLTCGGYAFDAPSLQRGGAWVSPSALAGPLPAATRPTVVPEAARWSTVASEGAPAPTVLTDVVTPEGTRGVEIATDLLVTYNSAIAALPQGLPGSFVSLRVKGARGTPKAAFELDEADGSRWRVMLPLTEDWCERRYSAADFVFMPDKSPKTRGRSGDTIRFENVRRVNFGLTVACLRSGSPYRAAFADLKTGTDPEGESRLLAARVPHVNTRYAFIRTALFPEPQQIGVFDPSFLLEDVAETTLAPELAGVFPAVRVPGRFNGFAAVGPLGLDGRGFSVNRCAWRPLLAAEAKGETYPAAGLLRHYEGTFAGSSWAFFGVADADLFAPGAPVRETLLKPLVDNLISRTFLHETEAGYATYARGETAKLLTKASNFSKVPRAATVRFTLKDEAGRVVHAATTNLTLAAGRTQAVALPWRVADAAPDFLFLTAELTCGGRLVDREEGALVVKDAAIRAALPRPKVVADHLDFGGGPRFTVGTQNFWGQCQGYTGRSPLYYYRDFRRMRDFGFCWTRCSCMFANERETRFFDALVQLASKFGITMYWTTWGQTETDEKGCRRKYALSAKGAARYRDVGGFLVDICNEPSVSIRPFADDFGRASAHQAAWAAKNREAARAANPGVLCAVGHLQGWGGVTQIVEAQLTQQTMDFTDRHYYKDPAGMAVELKSVDRRVFGQPLVLGECGAKCHPTNRALDPRGDGDNEEEYARRFRCLFAHAFGLGASALSVWQWRDPLEGIMAAGLMHQTNVPRPAALVCAEMAKAFASAELAPNPPDTVVVFDETRRFAHGRRAKAIGATYRLIAVLAWWGANFSCISSSELDRLPKTVMCVLRPEEIAETDVALNGEAALRAAVGARLRAANAFAARQDGDPATFETFRVPCRGATAWVFWNGGAESVRATRGGVSLDVGPGRVGYLRFADDGALQLRACW